MDFATFQSKPKAELHVHLEGSITPARLVALGKDEPRSMFYRRNEAQAARSLRPRKYLQTLVALTKKVGLKKLSDHFRKEGFFRFLNNFMAGYHLLHTAADFQAVTEDLLASFEQQGVTCAHVNYSPGLHTLRLGRDIRTIHDGIEAGLKQFPKIRVEMVMDALINGGAKFIDETLDTVLGDRRDFLKGFSIGGGSAETEMHRLVRCFHRASKEGLFCVAHVGEVDGPENIDVLLKETDVVRIAHGCSAVRSDETLALLKRSGVIVDVCPSSNLCTFVVPNLKVHPLQVFAKMGIPFTINTDDPLHFGTDLYREYQNVLKIPGLTESHLEEARQRSLEAFSNPVRAAALA